MQPDFGELAPFYQDVMSHNLKTILITLFLVLPLYTCAHDAIHKGAYIWGHEVNVFKPCGSKGVYWVSYNWEGNKIKEYYNENTTQPYQSIYLEFRGHYLNEEVDGFAEDYDGLIHISEIKTLSAQVPSTCK